MLREIFSELQFIAMNMTGEKESSDAWIYLLAITFGLIAGSIQGKFGDLLLTALVVMAFTMFLGILRPQRPWRWMLIVAVLVLMSQAGAYFFFAKRASRERSDRMPKPKPGPPPAASKKKKPGRAGAD